MKINEYYWHDCSLNNGELIYSNNFDGIMTDNVKYLHIIRWGFYYEKILKHKRY